MQVSLAAAAPEDLDNLDDLAVESSLLLAPLRPRPPPTPARLAGRASSTDFWCLQEDDWRHDDDADEGLLLPLA